MNRLLIFFMAIFGFNNAYFVMNQDQLTNFLNQAKESPNSYDVYFSDPKIVPCQIKLENGYCKIGYKENDKWDSPPFLANGEMAKLVLPELQKLSGKSSYYRPTDIIGATCIINNHTFNFVEVEKGRPCLMEIQLGGQSGPFFQSLTCEAYALREFTFDRFFEKIFTGMSRCISEYIKYKSSSNMPLLEMLKDFSYRKKFFPCDCNQTAASLDLINFIVANLPFELSQEELSEKLSQAQAYSLEKRMLKFAFDLRAQGGAFANFEEDDLKRVKKELKIAAKKITEDRFFSSEHSSSDFRKKSSAGHKKVPGSVIRLAKRVVQLPEPEQELIESDSLESVAVAHSAARTQAPRFREQVVADPSSQIHRSSLIDSLNISQESPRHSSGYRSGSVGPESSETSDSEFLSSQASPRRGSAARSLRRRPPAQEFSPDQTGVSPAEPIRSLEQLPEPEPAFPPRPLSRLRRRRAEFRGGGTIPLGEGSLDHHPALGADFSRPGQRNSLPPTSDVPVVGVRGLLQRRGRRLIDRSLSGQQFRGQGGSAIPSRMLSGSQQIDPIESSANPGQ